MVRLHAALGVDHSKKELRGNHDWTDPCIALGPDLRVGDLLHFDRRRAMAAQRAEVSLLRLADSYNAIRAAWNGPIRITSAFCPEPFARSLGRQPDCLHTRGMALDLVPLDGTVDHFHRWLKKRWSGGLIRHSGSVHIDLRNRGRFSKKANLKPTVTW